MKKPNKLGKIGNAIFCCICGNEINKKLDTYYKIDLNAHGELQGTDYAHKECWMKKNKNEQKINNLLEGLSRKAEDLGILEPKNKEIYLGVTA
jgi:hypothetical protein